jgi:low temperature requirement protein LtrA
VQPVPDDTDKADRVQGGDLWGEDQMSRWVELFYDLAFVGAILILSSAALHAEPSSHMGWIAFIFAASWWVWFTTTIMANRYRMIDHTHRVILLVQMILVLLMAMEAHVSLEGESTAMIVEYGLLLLTVAAIAFRAQRHDRTANRYTWRLMAMNALAAVLFLVAAVVHAPWRGVLCVCALVTAVVPFVLWLHRREIVGYLDEAHLVERMAAFTLIVFGEAFIEVAISVDGSTIGTIDVTSLLFEFVLVLALFTSYFEDIPAAGLRRERFRWWAGGHLLAQACIAATAIAASQLISDKVSETLPDWQVFRLTVPLAVLYLALAVIGASTRRRPARPLVLARVASAAVMGLFVLVVWWAVPVRLDEALPFITVVAIADAVVVVRLRDRTQVVAATPVQVSPDVT